MGREDTKESLPSLATELRVEDKDIKPSIHVNGTSDIGGDESVEKDILWITAYIRYWSWEAI